MKRSGRNDEPIAALLAGLRCSNREAKAQVMESMSGDLRRIAARYLTRGRKNHTLQPTAVVNEAYLKLTAQDLAREDRAHFLAAAAIRDTLVDSARAQRAVKWAFADNHPVDVLALEEPLDEMRKFDPRSVRLIDMRFHGGLSIKQTAHLLGVSSRAAKRDFEAARRWLKARLETTADVQPRRSLQ
jgi:RNA polymerase sigma factor (TIGR02999 family)